MIRNSRQQEGLFNESILAALLQENSTKRCAQNRAREGPAVSSMIDQNQAGALSSFFKENSVLKKTTMKKISVMFANVHMNFEYGVVGLMSP